MVDKLRHTEQFWAEMPDIQSAVLGAVGRTGLQSTTRLCHYINWAIALKLRQSLGAPITELKKETFPGISRSSGPTIAYASYAYLGTATDRINHSFPIVFGVESSPVLIDGANDQQDKRQPFLVKKLDGVASFSELTNALFRVKHFLDESRVRRQNLKQEKIEVVSKYLELLFLVGGITEQEYATANAQFQLEKSAECGFLYLSFSRDWITYFARALGVEYPSMQAVQDKMFEVVRQAGYQDPRNSTPQDRDLAALAKRLLGNSR